MRKKSAAKSYKSLKCPNCEHGFVRWMGKVTSGTTTCPKCKARFSRLQGSVDPETSQKIRRAASMVRNDQRFRIAALRPSKSRAETSKEFYASRAWQEIRYRALQLHGARCQCCGASRADDVVIHVDHIKPRYHFPELELELSNLQILCEACNLGKGAWDETDWRDAAPGAEPKIDFSAELDAQYRATMGGIR